MITYKNGWLAVILMIATSPLSASVIYDNGPVNLTIDARLSHSSSSGFNNFVADDFTLSSGANNVQDVHWWGTYTTDILLDDFDILIYEDVDGSPTTPIGSSAIYAAHIGDVGRTDTGIDVVGLNVYEYWADIPMFTATPDETYWLSIVNSNGSIDSPWFWSFDIPIGIGANSVSTEFGTSWINLGDRYAFNLTNKVQVPEPATLALFGIGLAGLGFARKKRKST